MVCFIYMKIQIQRKNLFFSDIIPKTRNKKPGTDLSQEKTVYLWGMRMTGERPLGDCKTMGNILFPNLGIRMLTSLFFKLCIFKFCNLHM